MTVTSPLRKTINQLQARLGTAQTGHLGPGGQAVQTSLQLTLPLSFIATYNNSTKTSIQSPIMKADIVYLHIPNLLKQGTSKKLQPIFSGPYLVCKRPNIHTATLRDIKTGKLLTRNVHVDRLKRITEIRNNKFAGRLIKPDNDQLKKMWKINDKEIKATEQLLRTDNKIQARPTHSKVKRRSKRGQKST